MIKYCTLTIYLNTLAEFRAHKMALIYRLEISMVCGIVKSSIFSL